MPKAYTNEEKAQALATIRACNNNVSQASRILGIPRKTLIGWRDGKGVQNVNPEMIDFHSAELSDKLDIIAHKLVDAIPQKIQKAPLNQISQSLKAAIDARNLLKGQPTAIIERRSDKDRYEVAVSQLIKECKNNNIEVTRLEAIDLLEGQLPGIKATLHKPTEITQEKPF